MNSAEKFLNIFALLCVYIIMVIKFIGRTFLTPEALFIFFIFILILLLSYFVLYMMSLAANKTFMNINDFFKTIFSKSFTSAFSI